MLEHDLCSRKRFFSNFNETEFHYQWIFSDKSCMDIHLEVAKFTSLLVKFGSEFYLLGKQEILFFLRHFFHSMVDTEALLLKGYFLLKHHLALWKTSTKALLSRICEMATHKDQDFCRCAVSFLFVEDNDVGRWASFLCGHLLGH